MSIAIPYYTGDTEFILITIPIQMILTYVPHIIRLFVSRRLPSKYDNANPRLYISSLENEALVGNTVAATVVRCNACTLNCLEDLLIWAPAPIVNLLFSESPKMGVALGALHLIFRVAYIILYCFFSSPALSYVRSFVFWAGWLFPMIMLFEAAHNIGPRNP